MSIASEIGDVLAAAIVRHDEKLDQILKGQKLMAQSVDALTAIVSTLVADTSAVLTDIAAALKNLPPAENPAIQAGIDDAVAKLTTLDASIKAADPAAPPAITPSTPVPTPTAKLG